MPNQADINMLVFCYLVREGNKLVSVYIFCSLTNKFNFLLNLE